MHSPSGIHQIQKCAIADQLCGYNREIKQITSTMKVWVDCSIRITFADAAIRVGCAQKLLIGHAVWIEAQDLQPGDVLLDVAGNHHVILGVEIIQQPALLYALSVENNVLCIEPYALLAHNAAAALLGVSGISLGVISIANPVAIAVGATLALSIIAKQALQIQQDQDASNDAHSATPNTWSERSYYEVRKKELEQLKIELMRIKKALETIKILCDTASFTYQFFKKVEPKFSIFQHPWLAITKDKEQRLTKTQQEELRALRQCDLLVREHEIIEFQVMLAMHSNELINHIEIDCAEYQSRVGVLPDSFHDFQCGYLDDTAIAALYACLVTQELMLDRIMRVVQEACCVAEYYQKLPSTSCINQSTTIVDAWKNAKPCITAKNQWIAQERKTCIQRMQVVEQYFMRRGGNIAKLKQGLRTTIENNLHKRENNIFSAILNKRDTVTQEATASATLPKEEKKAALDAPEDKDLLKRLLETRKPDGTIDLGNDSKDQRKKWFERLMEIMDEFFVKDSNKMEHIIRKIKHGFNDLLKERGFDKNVSKIEWENAECKLAREIQEQYVKQGDFPDQEFSNVFKREVKIDDYKVTVEGVMYKGLPRIGTAYIAAFREIYKHLM